MKNNLYLKKLIEHFRSIKIDEIKITPKLIANWIISNLTDFKSNNYKLPSKELIKLIWYCESGIISNKNGKLVLKEMFLTNKSALDIIIEKELLQENNENEIKEVINKVIKNNQKQVNQFKNGNKKIIQFLIGQVMKLTKGKANPKIVNEYLSNELETII